MRMGVVAAVVGLLAAGCSINTDEGVPVPPATGDTTACSLGYVSFDIPEGWWAQDIRHQGMKAGKDVGLDALCDIRSSTKKGFLRLYELPLQGTNNVIPTGRDILQRYLNTRPGRRDVRFADTDVGDHRGPEVSWNEHDNAARAFVYRIDGKYREDLYLVVAQDIPATEFDEVLRPPYLLARKSIRLG